MATDYFPGLCNSLFDVRTPNSACETNGTDASEVFSNCRGGHVAVTRTPRPVDLRDRDHVVAHRRRRRRRHRGSSTFLHSPSQLLLVEDRAHGVRPEAQVPLLSSS